MTRQARPAGFTLVELMVAIAVFGVLAAIAAPSFGNFIANQRVKTQAANLFADLNYARSEAIKRNGTISVVPISTAGTGPTIWKNGWRIIDAGVTDPIRVTQLRDGLLVTGPAGGLVYSRSGRLTNDANAQVDLCDESGTALLRTIRVDLSGRPNLTVGDNCQAPL